jgi:hypothetical protein
MPGGCFAYTAPELVSRNFLAADAAANCKIVPFLLRLSRRYRAERLPQFGTCVGGMNDISKFAKGKVKLRMSPE